MSVVSIQKEFLVKKCLLGNASKAEISFMTESEKVAHFFLYNLYT